MLPHVIAIRAVKSTDLRDLTFVQCARCQFLIAGAGSENSDAAAS